MRWGRETKLNRSHWTVRLGPIALAALLASVLMMPAPAFAQGFGLGQLFGGSGGGGGGNSSDGGGLSQLFGGGGGGQRHQRSQQSDGSGISVDRGAPPYTGKFTGKQDTEGMQSSITADFACYPAHDADIPQTNAFVCYTGQSNPNSPPSGRRSDSSAVGATNPGAGYRSSDSRPPDGQPAGIE